MVKDFPILFQPDMVRAILERRKMQTRRIPNRFNAKWQVGDHLWVRELWRTLEQYDGLSPSDVPVRAPVAYYADGAKPGGFGKWRQSLFIPRWASRLTMEVVQVRLQRLQEITEEDARAEGVSSRAEFVVLWDRINAKRGYPWESNPFVQAITFEMVSHAWRERQSDGAHQRVIA